MKTLREEKNMGVKDNQRNRHKGFLSDYEKTVGDLLERVCVERDLTECSNSNVQRRSVLLTPISRSFWPLFCSDPIQ